jgi:hypothetical protein
MTSKRKYSDIKSILHANTNDNDNDDKRTKALAVSHEQNEIKHFKDQIENLNSILQMKNSLIETLQTKVNQLEAKLVRYEGGNDAELKRHELLALPFDALAKILHEFLTMEDIANLDSAFCVHAAGRRKIFLNILSCGTFHGHGSGDRAYGKSYLKWLSLRKVAVKMLNLKYCSDYFLGVIAKLCSNVLESLVVRNSKFTNEGVKRILPCLPLLKKLTINNSAKFTSTGLFQIVQRCPLVENVNFTGQCFSSTALESFAAGCPKLKLYDIRGCERLSPAVAERITKSCPLLNKDQFLFDEMREEEVDMDEIIHAIMLGVQHAHGLHGMFAGNGMPDEIIIGIGPHNINLQGQHNIHIINGIQDMPDGLAEFLHHIAHHHDE